MYPKKQTTKAAAPAANATNDPKREKLLAIQEREQLKGLLVNKFIEKYANSKQTDKDFVNKQVADFIKGGKVTEDNLRKLEQKIKEGVDAQSVKASTVGQNRQEQPHSAASQQRAVNNGNQGYASQSHYQADDAVSVASSQKARSVYVQDDSDDEWATMMKYDTDLYKKEKELAKARELEQKRKIKDELDRQIEEKRRVRDNEGNEIKRYAELVDGQLKHFDVKEKKKEVEKHSKIMQEKASRDKQLHDEHMRRKLNTKNEKQMDELLVKKVQQELTEESRAAIQKRQEEKYALKKVLDENEENKIKMAEQLRREKEADVRAQQEYTRLIEKQEADRAAELKAREDRAKRFMNMMADTVVKDQKAQILAEEKKLLAHVNSKEAQDAEEDRRRNQRLNDQKKEMRDYLDQQMAEKERKKQEEKLLEKKQAEIWKKDTDDYNNHEKSKTDYIRGVNKGHAEFLQKQVEEERKRQKKITTQELLFNKPTLKQIAVQGEEPHFHKQLVNPRY